MTDYNKIDALAAWLRKNHPCDVIMPVRRGEKQPMFVHRNASWNWNRFDKHRKKHGAASHDYCIVLHDVCIIDVDSHELAADLERRFPALRSAPCEITARGRHFWFLRPAIADRHGYYDGAGQRTKGIDLKTVCHTGTGGIVLVAPSTGKRWSRVPLDAPLVELPLEVLDAIAVPIHVPVDVRLNFADTADAIDYPGCRWLTSMEYFEPMLSDDFGTGGTIPVPCDRETFDDIVYLLDNRELPHSCDPSRDRMDHMWRTCDMLGVLPRLYRCLRTGRPREQADVYDISPSWWRAHVAERACRLNRDDGLLVRIDAKVAGVLSYAPIAKDARWLFEQLPHVPGIVCGDRVLHADPAAALLAVLPAPVTAILARHRDCLVLAGGAVTGAVAVAVHPGSDYDVFVYGIDRERADEVLDDIQAAAYDALVPCTTSRCAMSMCFPGDIVVQVVLRLHETRSQIVCGFDLAPCKAIAYFGSDDCMVVEALPSWVDAVCNMAFWVDTECWSAASSSRILKYVAKGFEAAVPGTRRAAFRMQSNRTTGLRGLFDVEATALASHAASCIGRVRPMKRLQPEEAVSHGRHLGRSSDYHVVIKFARRLVYVIRALAWHKKVDTKDREWRTCDTAVPCMSTFHPSNPGLDALYDASKL